MTFDALGVLSPAFHFLIKSDSSYCEGFDTGPSAGVSHDQVMEYDFDTNKYTEITKIEGGLAGHGCAGYVQKGRRALVTVGGYVNSLATGKFLSFFL